MFFLLKLLNTLPKLNICEKRRKNFGKLVTQQNLRFLPKEKKTSPFFLKDLCQIYFVQKNRKNFSENFLLKKQVLTLLVYKKKKKNRLLSTSFGLNGKILLILFKTKFACGQKENR